MKATDSLDPAVAFNVVVFGGEDGWKGITLFLKRVRASCGFVFVPKNCLIRSVAFSPGVMRNSGARGFLIISLL